MASLRLLQHMLPSILILASLQACMGDTTVPAQLNNDILGLLVFKSDLHDPSSYLASWNEDDDSPCSWEFVQCNPATGRVSQLSLEGLGLLGRIGKGLQNLQHLKVLSLSNNNFSGDISTEKLALPPNLESLNLSRNSLSGLLPTALVNMSSIKFVDLSENSLSGALPDNLFDNCFSLRYLSLSGNLLQGPLPSTLPRCSVLNGLNLSNNHFSGNPDFASGIWSLKRLRTLDFSNNAFSGSVPQGISALHNLKVLLLQGNDFSGPVPADIGLCPHLGRVDLSYNLFTGALPDSLQRLNSLTFFSLSDNMFTGDFPQWIGNMSSLKYLDFSNNGFTGSLPASIGDLKSLNYLSLSNNKLVGAIPLSLAYCNELSVIRLRDNSFSGSIPEGLFDLGLEEIDFSQMGLTGSIPPGSSRLFESLKMLDLSRNNLKGNIPAEVGLFSNLRYLNLSWNNLQSRMPPELGFFQNLTVLDLRNSALFGSIPGDICDSGSLGILQLDGNSLNGPIPNEIGNCSSLYLMSLSHNNLSGLIPKSISKLNKLKILKLEYNELSGEIPQELGRLENLLAVNISYNRLVGRLPVGSVFQSLDQTALQGNLGICSPLLKGPCTMNVPKPLVLDPNAYNNQMGGHRHRDESPMSTTDRHHMFLSISAIVAISAATLIVVGVIIISLLNVSARRRPAFVETALESMCSSSSRSGSLASGKLILFDSRSSPEWISSPESLLNKASEIGEGVFGTVYKIPLGAQGRVVAIKKLVTSNIIQCHEDFDREVRILGKARHPNLIALKGYYWTPQMQLLVTEFATNGSLQSKLHERLPSTPPLAWANRFKILLGAAKGLAHLHHSYRPPIIHYNIKPSNILLDENYNPKISDFALVRLLTKIDQHVVSNRFQSALGYVAPELACQSLRVNEKCDVYGFGVLILELVTGRRPVEYGEDNVVILTDHVRVLLEQGNVLGCIDLSMGQYPEDEVLPVLKLALVCTSQIPSCRPTMAEVVQIMQIIKTPIPQTLEAF
ncbi:probably inactive leucine-rich repeat receptor-like protein kinase At3g28040 [Prunus avium]|uniref:Probably inactive leucine-rich repeat receptor-like protein kinase At3g28040 n=2 Tax=Prunus TaxID=3754 RepID=A0A6P5RPJ9_PRUAV|nr:probably inactive leucine-rich repeat receptor-like protein kinase At3g28040 [Prunus avium]